MGAVQNRIVPIGIGNAAAKGRDSMNITFADGISANFEPYAKERDSMIKKVLSQGGLFALGGGAYYLIELMWKQSSHWSMFLAGGLCFQTIHNLNAKMRDSKCIWEKCFIGSGIITGVEFVFGCVVNLSLHLNIWDYSAIPLNLLGQICLPFSMMWYLLTIPIIWVSDGICHSTTPLRKQYI